MKKLFNRLFKRKAVTEKKQMDSLSSIGYTYIQACKKDSNFRRKMEATEFGKAVKQHLITFRKEAELNG